MHRRASQAEDRRGKPVVIDVAVRAGPSATPSPTPIPNLRLAMLKSSPLLHSQDILAALHDAVDNAADDLLATERTRGIPSARAGGQSMARSPLSRYIAETAFQEKKSMSRAQDQAAMERATTPAALAPQAPQLAGGVSRGGEGAETWKCQGSRRRIRGGFKGLFACFGL